MKKLNIVIVLLLLLLNIKKVHSQIENYDVASFETLHQAALDLLDGKRTIIFVVQIENDCKAPDGELCLECINNPGINESYLIDYNSKKRSITIHQDYNFDDSDNAFEFYSRKFYLDGGEIYYDQFLSFSKMEPNTSVFHIPYPDFEATDEYRKTESGSKYPLRLTGEEKYKKIVFYTQFFLELNRLPDDSRIVVR